MEPAPKGCWVEGRQPRERLDGAADAVFVELQTDGPLQTEKLACNSGAQVLMRVFSVDPLICIS